MHYFDWLCQWSVIQLNNTHCPGTHMKLLYNFKLILLVPQNHIIEYCSDLYNFELNEINKKSAKICI
jgi:hypothetical protein